MSSQTEIPYQALHQIGLLATITRTGTDTADQGHSPIPIDTAATATMIPTEAVPGHIIETIDIIIGVLHDTLTPVLIIPAMTPHIADCLHTGAHQLTLGTTADHKPTQHTNQKRKPCINLHPIPAEVKAKLHDKRNLRVIIDDPHMDFYSSEDNSSGSEEDSDHLN